MVDDLVADRDDADRASRRPIEPCRRAARRPSRRRLRKARRRCAAAESRAARQARRAPDGDLGARQILDDDVIAAPSTVIRNLRMLQFLVDALSATAGAVVTDSIKDDVRAAKIG